MDSWLAALALKGYTVLFAVVFLEAIGFPIPAALGLLIAGGAAARGSLVAVYAWLGSIAAMGLGDVLMFYAGRFTGWWVLGALCRLSFNPESCVLRSVDSFHRRGRMLLVIAKFIPGINTLAPPLAGSMNMRFLSFLRLDIAGTALYISTYFAVGFFFSEAIHAVTKSYTAMSTALEWGLAAAVVIFLGIRVWMWINLRRLLSVPTANPGEAAKALERGAIIYDVRSHGYYDRGATRIQGSRRLDPNSPELDEVIFPQDREIFLYCTCVREATSALVASALAERGIKTKVIKGGLRAWKKSGLPIEPVPEEEMTMLPMFD